MTERIWSFMRTTSLYLAMIFMAGAVWFEEWTKAIFWAVMLWNFLIMRELQAIKRRLQ